MITESVDSTYAAAEYSRQCTCPSCGSTSVETSKDVLNKIRNNTSEQKGAGSIKLSGTYCLDCSWFELERSADEDNGEHDISSTPSSDRKSPLAEDNGEIKLGNKKSVSIFHQNVTLLGDKAIYRAENHCPECASDVKITLKRVTPDSDSDENTRQERAEYSEEYHPIGEKCINYGIAGDGCSHKK